MRIVKKQIIEKSVPSKEVQGFWNNIWVEKTTHNENGFSIDKIYTALESLEERTWEGIKLDGVRPNLQKSIKSKFQEKDNIPNFWLNTFPERQENYHNFTTISCNKLVRLSVV